VSLFTSLGQGGEKTVSGKVLLIGKDMYYSLYRCWRKLQKERMNGGARTMSWKEKVGVVGGVCQREMACLVGQGCRGGKSFAKNSRMCHLYKRQSIKSRGVKKGRSWLRSAEIARRGKKTWAIYKNGVKGKSWWEEVREVDCFGGVGGWGVLFGGIR